MSISRKNSINILIFITISINGCLVKPAKDKRVIGHEELLEMYDITWSSYYCMPICLKYYQEHNGDWLYDTTGYISINTYNLHSDFKSSRLIQGESWSCFYRKLIDEIRKNEYVQFCDSSTYYKYKSKYAVTPNNYVDSIYSSKGIQGILENYFFSDNNNYFFTNVRNQEGKPILKSSWGTPYRYKKGDSFTSDEVFNRIAYLLFINEIYLVHDETINILIDKDHSTMRHIDNLQNNTMYDKR